MTNKYVIVPRDIDSLDLSADIMAHTEAEALELGAKYLNDNHHLNLQPSNLEVVDVERGHDGQHDIKLVLGKLGDWEYLYIDDECVSEGHSISASHLMDALMDVCEGQFTYVVEDEEKEEESEQ